MRYLLISSEDSSKKYIDVPREIIKDKKTPKNITKHKTVQNPSKKPSKKPIKRLNKKKQTSKALISYKRK